jgi:iron(III) transport system ATP-binding protein
VKRLAIDGLRKAYGKHSEVQALDGIDLAVAPSELLVLLGPSGCGKTTALRCLAGLERPDAGRVMIGEDTVFDPSRRIDLPPNQRDIGMVFQTYALWPHKTARQNVTYPLRARKLRAGLQEGWVEDMLRLVECEALADRYPGQLSGGQQQRVALARGLVARPGLVLFDEPLSNLDARLRDQVRSELHALHRRIKFTGVYVTHDQAEGLALADRLAIMRNGRVEQLAPPREVFEQPATDYIAGFLGYTDALHFRHDPGLERRWSTSAGQLTGLVPQPGSGADELTVRIRPEDVELVHAGSGLGDRIAVAAPTVQDVIYGGTCCDVLIDAGDAPFRATLPSRLVTSLGVRAGAQFTVAIDAKRVRTFGADGRAIAVRWSHTP